MVRKYVTKNSKSLYKKNYQCITSLKCKNEDSMSYNTHNDCKNDKINKQQSKLNF